MRAQRSSAGFTLIEVLIAMVVLGTGVVALITALGMDAKTTYANRNQAQASSILTAAAEYVKSQGWTASCGPATVQTITTAQVAHDSAFTVTYGPGAQLKSTACSSLEQVPVFVVGNGFNLTVTVLLRPVNGP